MRVSTRPLSSALGGATSNHAFELHGSKAFGSAIAVNVTGPVNLNAIRSASFDALGGAW